MDEPMNSNSRDGIVIDNENLRRYGFACFFPPGEKPENKDYAERQVILSAGSSSESEKITIPAGFYTELGSRTKVTALPEYRILSPTDAVEVVKQLSERAGWNQTSEDIARMHQMDTGHFITGELLLHGQSVPLGSGVTLRINEDLCWIGMILVHPELRRQGIASSIMQACVNHATHRLNTSVIGLDATPGGKQVYDELGFRDSLAIWRTLISTDSLKSSDAFLAPYEGKAVENFLKRIRYTERTALMQQLSDLPGAKCTMLVKDGDTEGFVLSRPGRLYPFVGPLIAGSDEAASALLLKVMGEWKNEGYSHVFMDIPEWHLEKQKVFVENGDWKSMEGEERVAVQKKRPFIRMYQLDSGIDVAHMSSVEDKTKGSFEERYDKTLAFMEKERCDILPFMYGICGPEWG